MTINRKTILTLAAVAVLAAALAPITASARGFGGGFGHGSDRFSSSSFRAAARPILASHAPTSFRSPSAWHHYTPPPTWHRPVEVKVGIYGYARPRYFAPPDRDLRGSDLHGSGVCSSSDLCGSAASSARW